VSDIFADRVLAITPSGEIEDIAKLERPSGLGWLPDGRLLIVSMKDREIKVFDKGTLSTWADLSTVCTGDPNDMVVDSKGRAYVGNTGCNFFAGEQEKAAELVLAEAGHARVVVPCPEMAFPNGTVITPDGKTLIIAESMANRLTAFSISQADGSLSRRRVYAELGESDPDGICLDAEGAVWFGDYGNGNFVRVLDGGEVTHVVRANGRRAVACMAGGPERRTLYMISAETVEQDLFRGMASCRIDWADLDVGGAGLP
jgi:sugar lactone lactonase YvrE